MHARAFLLLILALSCAGTSLAEPSKGTAPRPNARPSASAGPSQAAPPELQPAQDSDLFRRLDRDGNGSLSAAELARPEAREANWAALDRNRNGRIERQEFRAYQR